MAIAKKKSKPIARKPAPAAKPAAKPVAKKAAPVQRDIEETVDDGLVEALQSCETNEVVDAVLAALVERVDYIIAEKEETPENLAALWMEAKRLEQETVVMRRALEDAMNLLFPAEELEGTADHDLEGFNVKIAHKVTRTVDSEKLTELSEEYEIDDEIARLFRFKPELNLAAFRAESEEVQELFEKVITTKQSRPSYTITATE